MFVIELTTTGGFAEYRGMVRYYSGGKGGLVHPAVDRAHAQTYQTRDAAEKEVSYIKRSPAMKIYAIAVVPA